ncbi:uncharacterized protein ACIB01_013826 [Guaruba guarouba]
MATSVTCWDGGEWLREEGRAPAAGAGGSKWLHRGAWVVSCPGWLPVAEVQIQKAAPAPSPSRNYSSPCTALPCSKASSPHWHRWARISPGPSFSSQSTWKNQNEDSELKPIFLGTTAMSMSLGGT